jgi:general stress protein YciG
MAQQGNQDKRGFANMSEEERREIARKGGQSVPDEERSFSKDRDLASEAGRKGGERSGGGRRDRE